MAEIEKTFTVASRGVGLPDYSAPQPTGQVPVGPIYTLADVGESAARLGSIMTYDRRGNVIILDDFEEPQLRWNKAFVPPFWLGAEAILDNTNAKSGSQAIKLHTPAVAGAIMYIEKHAMVTVSKRLGVEISFSDYTVTGISPFPIHCRLKIVLTYFDGTNAFSSTLFITPVLGELHIEDDEGVAEILIAKLKQLPDTPNLFFTIKLVIDAETGKYTRLLFSQNEYDLSQYGLYVYADARAPFIQTRLVLENVGATANDIWLDDYIFTQNEPPNI